MEIEKINKVITKTLTAIEEGKEEMFDIAENAREELDTIKFKLENLQKKIVDNIEEINKLEDLNKRARTNLIIIGNNFDSYTEGDIKKAYQEANSIRIKLLLARQKEKDLIKEKNQLEISLENISEIMGKAEILISKVGVSMEYLRGNLNDILETIDDMSKRQYIGIKIIEAQEEERQRVARDIHDGPAQTMANVVLKTELCEKLFFKDQEQMMMELKNLKNIARGSLKDVRKIIYDLRPMSLEDLGLIPTVERYTYNFSNETGIEVKLNILDNQSQIDSITQIGVFRIIQEALNNIRKHSKAENVDISIKTSNTFLDVLISDDGVGMTVDNSEKDMCITVNGFGIMGMKERVELLNGNMEIKSQLGKGTKVVLAVPLNRKGENYV